MKIRNLFKTGAISVFIITLSSFGTSKKSPVPVDGLMAYFQFNNNANDESGNNNNGIINGATLTTDRFNHQNSTFFFDGNSDIKIPNPSFFNQMKAFCISVWVYPVEIKYRHNTIISKVNPNKDFNLKILRDNMKYVAHFAYGSTYYRCYSQNTIKLNTWTHIVYQWTGKKWL